LPVIKGYFLNHQDQQFKKYILDISCLGRTHFHEEDRETLEQYSFPQLRQLEQDGLLTLNPRYVELTPLGKFFVRNICRAFDLNLLQKDQANLKQTYSKAV
jgi:oxygen-independent coproporphyrinogen-3 oxidase